jgi:hypothetical protein
MANASGAQGGHVSPGGTMYGSFHNQAVAQGGNYGGHSAGGAPKYATTTRNA